MGDHRMSIKIEVEFHGVKDHCDMWVNFSERDVPGVDHRVVEFLQSVHDRGMADYSERIFESEREERENAEEKRDREEYSRLKQKFQDEEREMGC